MDIIKVSNISKSFASHKVLHNISFEVHKNEIFGLIGPDGAGKSTLFRILSTLLLPDSGECVINGFDIRRDFMEIRAILGYMPGNFSLYMDLSVEENLDFFASIYGTSIEENYDLIAAIYSQLEPFKKRRAKALSGGMKQKLALCCALIHKPEILFLDEPTTGVDAVSRKEFWDILGALKNNMTIVVSTPYMDEASLCDRVALMFGGKFLSLDTPTNICASYPYELYAFSDIPNSALHDIRKLDSIHSCYLFGESYHIAFKGDPDIQSIQKLLNTRGIESTNLTYQQISANIEDCFMEFLQ